MSIRNRLVGREFSEMGLFIDALQQGIDDELQPIRDEIRRLGGKIDQVITITTGEVETDSTVASSAGRISTPTPTVGTTPTPTPAVGTTPTPTPAVGTTPTPTPTVDTTPTPTPTPIPQVSINARFNVAGIERFPSRFELVISSDDREIRQSVLRGELVTLVVPQGAPISVRINNVSLTRTVTWAATTTLSDRALSDRNRLLQFTAKTDVTLTANVRT